MRKKIIIWTGSVLLLTFIIWIAIPKNKVIDQVFTSPVRGDFLVSVVVTGELEAKSAEEINGPTGLRTIGLWGEIKILDMVPEGTLVDSGDFVASLDKTEISSKIKDLESEI
ncbi:MAG: RND transporter, partial [Cytophagia bacterium]|nr:RND transporter [Cytophagia bacterium]